jgi:cell envelope opacity-associated protein A
MGQTNARSEARKSGVTDTISISPEAMQRAEFLHAREVIDRTPETRAAMVADLKAKIDDPSFFNDEVLNATAENILADLGF